MSKDPIGLGGEINIYPYAENSAGWIDPLGLARCPASRAARREAMRQAGIATRPTTDQSVKKCLWFGVSIRGVAGRWRRNTGDCPAAGDGRKSSRRLSLGGWQGKN
nr:hypothetical protein [Burkholderia pseudomultivorans]